MSYDMCVVQWPIDKTNKKNKWMLKSENVLRVMRSVSKSYLTLNKPTDKCSVYCLKTKLRPRFIGPFTVVAKKDLAYTLNLPLVLRTHP